jgi:hypothetical protein
MVSLTLTNTHVTLDAFEATMIRGFENFDPIMRES